MDFLTCVVLGCLPGAFWLVFLRRKDDHEPEPWGLVLFALAFGGLSTLAVVWTRPWFSDLLPLGTDSTRHYADAFLLTAPLEETWKMVALLFAIGWSREVDEPLDGIIYGTAVGLGFASIENVVYVLDAWDEGVNHALYVAGVRGVTATLVHCSTTGTIGFFYGLARLGVRPYPVRSGRPRSRGAWMLAFGWMSAVVFHGAFNAFLADRAAFLALLLVLPALLFTLSNKIHWARSRSEEFHKPTERRRG